MYNFIRNILEDKTTGLFPFAPFSLCHILYLVLITAAIVVVAILFKNKSQESKTKLINTTVTIALCIYIADFFLMPLSLGEINIDKLPFHLCTSMSIMCVLGRNNKHFAKYKTAFTLLGLIGALMYLVYPSGVATPDGKFFDGYTYRIVQTVLYHGLMVAQGVFAIVFKDIDLNWKNFEYDVIVILCLALWAMLGNAIYSGTVEVKCTCSEECTETVYAYLNDFNWFFVKHDALYIIPDDIDIYFAPFIMLIVISGMSALIRFLSKLLLKKFSKPELNVTAEETLSE